MNARPIKVAQLISPSGFYGAERWVVALANNLDPDRVDCAVVATSESNAQPEILQHLSAQTTGMAMPMSNRFDLGIVGRLAGFVRANRYQIIHSHGYKSDIIGLITAKLCGVPCLTTPHGFNKQTNLKMRMFVRLGAFALRHFDRVVPLSPELATEVAELGAPAHKIVQILNGLDLTDMPDHAPRAMRPVRHLAYVGQLIRRKAVDEIIETFDRLWAEDDRLKLSLIGDGECRSDLEALADSKPSRQAITFHGFRADRLAMLQDVDLFVMASKQEGVPRSMMEAMALGVPAVGYDIPGVDLLIDEHRETGIRARLAEPDALYNACRWAIQHDACVHDIGQRGRALVRDKFSAARMAREYSDLYKELVLA